MITGMPTSQTSSDSYIVSDYGRQPRHGAGIGAALPLRAIYSKADFFSRLSSNISLEDLIIFWKKHVDVYYDSTRARSPSRCRHLILPTRIESQARSSISSATL